MNSPRYIEVDFETARQRSLSYKYHSRRILTAKKAIDNELPAYFGKRASPSKVLERLRAETIRRENELLLTKLVDISQQPRSTSVRRISPVSKLSSRANKLENKRIDFENSLLSKRISGLESSLSFNKFQKDYRLQEQYKRRLTRVALTQAKLK